MFVPVRYHGHPLPVPQLKMSFSLQKDLKRHHMPSAFVTWLRRRKNPGRQLLLFVPTIGLAKKLLASATAILEQEMVIEGPQAIRSVHAEDPDREEIVQQFRRKELKVLITTTILERGVTFPSVDVAILDAGHDVFDEAALVQISGRAGRSAEDPTGEVIFFHGGKKQRQCCRPSQPSKR
ncbi:helicase-related protein [Virgibacillus sp. 179-BFC.A HS]|uniref:Helicase-related protein n=1 Tax=Tigheibacillus jepli TaxID=3035914 RepID=A0ABU5CFI1_9BACI|nr:helicase-related protein [Virgibacillus sp. 179-BFC.A HS]MDY0405082.1 helicase-related protein [Virgibacillus sp. 179-BFC.A HS]